MMIRKLLLFFFLIPFLKSGFSQTPNYTIEAEIAGIGNDTVYIMHQPLAGGRNTTDTVLAKKNKLTYKLQIKEPSILAIIPKKVFYKRKSGGMYVPATKFVELIALPGEKLKIRGILGEYYLPFLVKGSAVNAALSKHRLTYETPSIEAVHLELRIDSLSGIIEKKSEVAVLFNLRAKYFKEIHQARLAYIKQNPDSDLSAYYLGKVSLDSFAKYYPNLTSNVRSGIFSRYLQNKYEQYIKFASANAAEKELTAGSPAPQFSLKSRDGSIVSLSSFKGKPVVLEFWGTWCGPCMSEIPVLKKHFEAYRSEINFIGINCNDSEDNWKKAVIKHELSWTQLINSKNDDVSVLYGVMAYPTKIILDKDLNFIKRFVGAEESFYKMLDGLSK